MAQIENLNLELKSRFSFPLISWVIQVQILNPGTDLQIWKLEVKTFNLAPRFMGLMNFKCPKKLTEPKVRVYMSPTEGMRRK